MSSGKCAQVHELLDKLSGTMKTWAMFPVARTLTLDTQTTSAVEGEHSVMHRAINGGMSLSASSRLDTVVEKGHAYCAGRAKQRTILAHDRSASRGTEAELESTGLLDADRYLQPSLFPMIRRELTQACNYDVTFKATGRTGGMWEVSRQVMPSAAVSAICPTFCRVRYVGLCRSREGEYFLDCTCF